MYGFQPSTPVDKFLPLAEATADAADRLTNLLELRDVVKQLFILSKENIEAIFTRSPHIFHVGDIVYLFTRGLHIRQKNLQALEGPTA
jgi:hypothetical protein